MSGARAAATTVGRRVPGRAARLARDVVRARYRARPFVLMYHHVADVAADPWDLAVAPARFEQHMEVLRRSGRPLLTVGQLADALLARDLPPRSIVVTFDDGYADNARIALPILCEAGVPATVFVTSGAVGSRREMWWDDLERIVLSSPRRKGSHRIVLDGTEVRVDLGDPPDSKGWRAATGASSGRERQFLELWRLLQGVERDRRRDALDELATWADVPRDPRETHRMLDEAELRSLAAAPTVEIGSHTVTHADLTAAGELDWELVASRSDLERRTGRGIRSFAYPSGRLDAAAVAAVAAAGYVAAVTTEGGPVLDTCHPLLIPRVVVTDRSEHAFRALVARLG